MMEQIERIFGSWKPADVPAVPDCDSARTARPAVCIWCICPESVQTQVLVANHAITRKHPDWLRLALANSIYGGAFNSRLIMNIREQKGYTYSPRSGVHALRQHGYFSVNAAVRNDVVAATLTEIFYEIDRMRSLAVGEDELSDARTLHERRFLARPGHAGRPRLAALERISERASRRLSGDVSPAHPRPDRRRRAGRGARLFRFAQCADHYRGRPRADCRSGQAFRRRSPNTMPSPNEPSASEESPRCERTARKGPNDESRLRA